MVDLTSDSAEAGRVSVRTVVDRAAALEYVDALDPNVISTGYQNPIFLRAWLNQPTAQPYFLIFSQAGHGEVLLPLELGDKGIATYCGGTHANGNFPVGLRRDIEALSFKQVSAVIGCLAGDEIKPNVLFLERQHSAWQNCKNPFVNEDSGESPNVALSFSLEGGFAAVLERHHGKRKRKRQRSHMRKLEEMGSVEVQQHVPFHQVPDVLQAFFDMKAVRFREAGICDVFAEQSVKDMFAQMFMESCADDEPTYLLKALRLDGKPISVIGCTILDGRITVEFGAFDDAYAIGGPGDLLFYHAIENACEHNLEVFDFGIGDEFYKRSWCDIETWHKDTFIAITPTGKARAIFKHVRNGAVRSIKTNNFIWSKTKKVRKILGWIQKC